MERDGFIWASVACKKAALSVAFVLSRHRRPPCYVLVPIRSLQHGNIPSTRRLITNHRTSPSFAAHSADGNGATFAYSLLMTDQTCNAPNSSQISLLHAIVDLALATAFSEVVAVDIVILRRR